jgi:hypothetical protein
MSSEFSYQDRFPFLGFQICWNTNHQILVDIAREQFLYRRHTDSHKLRETLYFNIKLIEDTEVNSSWNTALQHHYDPISNVLFLSYLNDAITVKVDYQTRTVSANIMERALGYRSAIGNWVLTIPLSELLKLYDYFLMHAACMVWKDKGILFAGRSGVGKTTLALGLLSMGWQLVSDDEVFLTSGLPLMAYGGPEKAKVSWRSWQRFRYYLGEQSRFNGKRMLSLQDHFPDQIMESCSVAAICFVNQSDRIRVNSLEPLDVYRRLLSVAFLTSESNITRRNADLLYTICQNIPAYSLHVSLDMKALQTNLTKIPVFL